MNSAMSTRYELGAVAGGVDGSASGREALIRHAHCPVTVVPASLRAEADTT